MNHIPLWRGEKLPIPHYNATNQQQQMRYEDVCPNVLYQITLTIGFTFHQGRTFRITMPTHM